MAELIDREAFLKRFTSEYRCKFTFGEAKILNVMFEELKKEPTTTEAEIRASAISDFLQFVYDNASKYANEDGWAMSDLIDLEFKFTEQLKEHRKLNRCDTCNHYVADEVPPICYFCCKGMEDNYVAKE